MTLPQVRKARGLDLHEEGCLACSTTLAAANEPRVCQICHTTGCASCVAHLATDNIDVCAECVGAMLSGMVGAILTAAPAVRVRRVPVLAG